MNNNIVGDVQSCRTFPAMLTEAYNPARRCKIKKKINAEKNLQKFAKVLAKFCKFLQHFILFHMGERLQICISITT